MRFFDAWSFCGKSHGPALKSWTLWDDPPTIQVLQNEHDMIFWPQDLGAETSLSSQTNPSFVVEKNRRISGIFSPFLLAVFL